MRVVTTGGGGWGDPLEREPELVALDVLQGKVSFEAARRDYGVVLEERAGEYMVNERATQALRSELRGKRTAPLPLVDRGPGYEKMLGGTRNGN